MIIVILLDSSVSMNQKFSEISAFDFARVGIENFLTVYMTKSASLGNQSKVLKSPKVDNFIPQQASEISKTNQTKILYQVMFETQIDVVLTKVRMLRKTNDLSTPGLTFKYIFELLDARRLKNETDTPFHGRSIPYSIDPVAIMWFTNAARFQTANLQYEERLIIPDLESPGGDLYDKPYRWDHFIFTFLFKSEESIAEAEVAKFTRETGGTLFEIYSTQPPDFKESKRYKPLRALTNAISKVCGVTLDNTPCPTGILPFHGGGVRIRLVELDGEHLTDYNEISNMLFVDPPKAQAHKWFPLPEDCWIGETTSDREIRKVKRHSIPIIYYKKVNNISYRLPENWGCFEKYMVVPCPVVKELCSVQTKDVQWPVFMKNSYKEKGFGKPFGYLSPVDLRTSVNLVIFSYDYPRLLTFFSQNENILKEHNRLRLELPSLIKQEWNNYLCDIPLYYRMPLRTVFQFRSLDTNLVPPDDASRLKDFSNDMRNRATIFLNAIINRHNASDITNGLGKVQLYDEPFKVPRGEAQHVFLEMLRVYQQKSVESKRKERGELDEDEKHSLPIAVMLDHSKKLAELKAQRLRNPFEDEEERIEREQWEEQIAFGNPFKTREKSKRSSVDDVVKPQTLVGDSPSPSSWSQLPTNSNLDAEVIQRQEKRIKPTRPNRNGNKQYSLFESGLRKILESILKRKVSIPTDVIMTDVSNINQSIEDTLVLADEDMLGLTTSGQADSDFNDSVSLSLKDPLIKDDLESMSESTQEKDVQLSLENLALRPNERSKIFEALEPKTYSNINTKQDDYTLKDPIDILGTDMQCDEQVLIWKEELKPRTFATSHDYNSQTFVIDSHEKSDSGSFSQERLHSTFLQPGSLKFQPRVPISRAIYPGGVPESMLNSMKEWVSQIKNPDYRDVDQIINSFKIASQDCRPEEVRRFSISLSALASGCKKPDLAMKLKEAGIILGTLQSPSTLPISREWNQEGGSFTDGQEQLMLAAKWFLREINKQEEYNELDVKAKLSEITTENGYSSQQKEFLLKTARTVAKGNHRLSLKEWLDTHLENLGLEPNSKKNEY
ncbi:hypothetical protein G9A89_012253 [Geosiphon pyriformis]|nr:hypothetical protein G9A89_012253 [Geosiphon pyriformis]